MVFANVRFRSTVNTLNLKLQSRCRDAQIQDETVGESESRSEGPLCPQNTWSLNLGGFSLLAAA